MKDLSAPSSYRLPPADYLQIMHDAGLGGMHDAELCEMLKCGYSTLRRWLRDYPDFEDAYRRFKVASEAAWVRIGRAACLPDADGRTVRVNAQIYGLIMKNAFGWGNDSQNITIQNNVGQNLAAELSDADLERRLQDAGLPLNIFEGCIADGQG